MTRPFVTTAVRTPVRTAPPAFVAPAPFSAPRFRASFKASFVPSEAKVFVPSVKAFEPGHVPAGIARRRVVIVLPGQKKRPRARWYLPYQEFREALCECGESHPFSPGVYIDFTELAHDMVAGPDVDREEDVEWEPMIIVSSDAPVCMLDTEQDMSAGAASDVWHGRVREPILAAREKIRSDPERMFGDPRWATHLAGAVLALAGYQVPEGAYSRENYVGLVLNNLGDPEMLSAMLDTAVLEAGRIEGFYELEDLLEHLCDEQGFRLYSPDDLQILAFDQAEEPDPGDAIPIYLDYECVETTYHSTIEDDDARPWMLGWKEIHMRHG